MMEWSICFCRVTKLSSKKARFTEMISLISITHVSSVFISLGEIESDNLYLPDSTALTMQIYLRESCSSSKSFSRIRCEFTAETNIYLHKLKV